MNEVLRDDTMQHNAPSSAPLGGAFVKSNQQYSSIRSTGSRGGYQMPGSVNMAGSQLVPQAQPVMPLSAYHSAWLAEQDPVLKKFRKLAYEVLSLKTERPNAKDKLHSACNRVPIQIGANVESVLVGAGNQFVCRVDMERVIVATGRASKIKDAKTNAHEIALQKILMPYLHLVQHDNHLELEGSQTPFPPASQSTRPAVQPRVNHPSLATTPSCPGAAGQHKESNMEAAGRKRRPNEFKPLEDFVIVEPLVVPHDCNSAHTLRRSADFNHMLLEYEYFFLADLTRCVLKIENNVLADVKETSKIAAKNTASDVALRSLRELCWVIKTKQSSDSEVRISKEEMLSELSDQRDVIGGDNIGNKLLRKMGWEGGGVGKDGSGIAEPVSLKSVFNRQGLGLSSAAGITEEFRRKVKEIIENYAVSDKQEDLLFSSDFRIEERQVIHDVCRKLNLKSKSRGKGGNRYLCISRRRSAFQLFDHIMSCGGETSKYKLLPPGSAPTQGVGSAPTQRGGSPPTQGVWLSVDWTGSTVEERSVVGSGGASVLVKGGATTSTLLSGPTSSTPLVGGPSSSTSHAGGPSSSTSLLSGPSSSTSLVSGPSSTSLLSGPSSTSLLSGPSSSTSLLSGPSSSTSLEGGPTREDTARTTIADHNQPMKHADNAKQKTSSISGDQSATDECKAASESRCGDMDIDSLRDQYESSTEWRLRRKFLMSNIDLPLDRLVCLSRCFVNITMYGCAYPGQVMREVSERAAGIQAEVKEERKSQMKQNYVMFFVRASDEH
ncbi:uncharacterized protein LOC131937817 [Physella acuta]|uniref:uncharacterized protein LOC131937817 n=1 Tax=Physella acuta TaxID=109671 RepID=UPI0027DC75C0|nr:uncharacterized protein LOC131937817 [Physella acuta]